MYTYPVPLNVSPAGLLPYRARYGHKIPCTPAEFDLGHWTVWAYGNWTQPPYLSPAVRALRQDELAVAFGVEWWEVD